MALIVEDGTGISTANSYIEVSYADDYFALRGVSEWSDATTVAKETAIVKGTDYIRTRWASRLWSQPLTLEQALDFPRANLPAIPEVLKMAVAEYALRALSSELMPDPVAHASGRLVNRQREKIGPIEEEYEFAGSGSTMMETRSYPAADRLMATLVAPSGRVYR